VIIEAGEDEGILTAEIGINKVDEVRSSIPIFADRRPEIYRWFLHRNFFFGETPKKARKHPWQGVGSVLYLHSVAEIYTWLLGYTATLNFLETPWSGKKKMSLTRKAFSDILNGSQIETSGIRDFVFGFCAFFFLVLWKLNSTLSCNSDSVWAYAISWYKSRECICSKITVN